MQVLTEGKCHQLARQFQDDLIPLRFRGFRYGSCPPTFRSADGVIEVRQRPDGKWVGKANGGTCKGLYATPSEAKRGIFQTKQAAEGGRRLNHE